MGPADAGGPEVKTTATPVADRLRLEPDVFAATLSEPRHVRQERVVVVQVAGF